MAKVSIFVNKQPFTVTCGDGEEERVRSLGSVLDRRVKKMDAVVGGGVSNSQLMLLTALTLLDEFEAIRGAHRPAPEHPPIDEQHLTHLLSLAERLTTVSKEMSDFCTSPTDSQIECEDTETSSPSHHP